MTRQKLASLLNDFMVIQILLAIALIALVLSAIVDAMPNIAAFQWWGGVLQNFGTEVIGAGLTYALIEVLVRLRREREDIEEKLRYGDTRYVYILGDKDLDISEMHLEGVVWHRAYLNEADLSNAKLERADLRRANLRNTNLQHANLYDTNLYEADLTRADLRHADLRDAYLYRANLEYAKLEGTKLDGAVLDEETILPDGSKWTPDRDLREFTEPELDLHDHA